LSGAEHTRQEYRHHCPRCGNKLRTIIVHGHEQCLECDQVIYDCCQGETCDQEWSIGCR